MKVLDRMAAFEAPRVETPLRPMRAIELRFRGGGHKNLSAIETVQIPKAMTLPDVIRYRNRTFVHRSEKRYEEASIWPILDELDGG